MVITKMEFVAFSQDAFVGASFFGGVWGLRNSRAELQEDDLMSLRSDERNFEGSGDEVGDFWCKFPSKLFSLEIKGKSEEGSESEIEEGKV